MLNAISIRNVVLIETLDLDLQSGFTAFTGETGAGKSIILDALAMATGARSDRGLVRKGADKAQCTACFSLEDTHPAWALLDTAEIDYAPGEDLVLRRTISSDGRSRAFINDHPASAKLLSAIGDLVLEVHGQHDGRGLLDSNTHRDLLDKTGGYTAELSVCAAAYTHYQAAKTHAQALMAARDKADETREMLEHSISELDRLSPMAGEDADLSAKRKLMQHAEGALSELTAASEALGADGEYESRIAQALARLERTRAKIDDGQENSATSALSAAGSALEKALIELEEARAAVSAAAELFEFEPGRLNEVEERLFALRAAARKYGTDIDGLLALRQKFGDDLLALERSSEDIKAAERALITAKADYDKAAAALSQKRKSAGQALDAQVAQELPPLKMQNAQFITHISEAPDSAAGRDQVRFDASTNPGMAIGPLAKIASGGELSRFALAIKVALAGRQANKGETVMIFDEVDQGVGGAVASAVGKRLSDLSKTAQVIVVTHSPQVAASADHQILIQKTSTGGKTLTDVTALESSAREEEIARMLAGESITDAARAAARQLMKAV